MKLALLRGDMAKLAQVFGRIMGKQKKKWPYRFQTQIYRKRWMLAIAAGAIGGKVLVLVVVASCADGGTNPEKER